MTGKIKRKVFHYEGGIKEYVEYLNKGNQALYDEIIYCEGNKTELMLKLHSSIMTVIPIMYTDLLII